MHVYIYLLCLVTQYVYVLNILSFIHFEPTSLWSGEFDEEITTHSQYFLSLNILMSSVKLAQELILLFNIRGDNIRSTPD